jgi:hypothetical protein
MQLQVSKAGTVARSTIPETSNQIHDPISLLFMHRSIPPIQSQYQMFNEPTSKTVKYKGVPEPSSPNTSQIGTGETPPEVTEIRTSKPSA